MAFTIGLTAFATTLPCDKTDYACINDATSDGLHKETHQCIVYGRFFTRGWLCRRLYTHHGVQLMFSTFRCARRLTAAPWQYV